MLIQAIDEYLDSRPKDRRVVRCFHPSSLHRDEQYLYEAYFGAEADSFSARTLRIFDNGHDVHSRLQECLKKAGILKQAEVPVENHEYEIKGHADGIVLIAGVTGVLEIKSINSNWFRQLFEPKREHKIQLNVYMFCLGTPQGVILYECKDNQELKEFYLKQDERILKPVLEKIRRVQERIKNELEK